MKLNGRALKGAVNSPPQWGFKLEIDVCANVPFWHISMLTMCRDGPCQLDRVV